MQAPRLDLTTCMNLPAPDLGFRKSALRKGTRSRNAHTIRCALRVYGWSGELVTTRFTTAQSATLAGDQAPLAADMPFVGMAAMIPR
jgi:hypothetical protein